MNRTTILSIFALITVAASTAHATSDVDPFYGSFANDVPIIVPPFHSLEPQLKLSYSSTGRDGFAGVGWDLSGVRTIERMSPGGGAPRFDAGDQFFLDGQPLIPSAVLGGTHVTNIQSYVRIQQDVPGAGQWTMTQKDGTRSIFSAIQTVSGSVCNTCPVANTCTITDCNTCGQTCTGGFDKFGNCQGWSCNSCQVTDPGQCGTSATTSCAACGATSVGGTFKWGLTSVVDPRGNAVDYSWSCPGDGECYPSSIAYNGATVTLWREPRPDATTFANGVSVGTRAYRLKSIDVRLGAALVRAYRLDYTTSASTTRSLLASVQQYGRDASVDGAGTISGGTTLPAMSFGYQAGGSATNTCYETCYDECPPICDKNGCVPSGQQCNPHNCNPYACSSFLEKSYDPNNGWDFGTSASNYPVVQGDWNGDGKSDFARLGGTGAHVFLSNGNNSFARSYDPTPGWDFGYTDTNYPPLTGDWNGDGKSDFVRMAGTGTYVFLSNGNGTFAPSFDPNPGWDFTISATNYPGLTGDWNGDGKTDYLRLAETGAYVFLSNGNGTFAASFDAYPGWNLGNTIATNPPAAGDWNGDGKTDYARMSSTGTYVFMSNGNGTFTASFDANPGWDFTTSSGNYPAVVGDWNGDGKTDFARLGGTGAYVFVSNGNGTFTRSFDASPGWDLGNSSGTNAALAGDWNGDGLTDFVRLAGTGNYVFQSNGNGTFTHSYDANPGWDFGDSATEYPRVSADWNGDGNTDYARLGGTGVYLFKVAGAVPDLLTTTANGLGGGTSVGYRPSSDLANTFLPVGMIVQTASQVTTSDGRAASSTTSYTYAGGLWSNAERRFLGFRKVTAVINAAGDYTETYYHQHVGCIAKPETTYYRNANGAIYNFSQMAYAESSAPPYTSLMTERWDYECNQDASCRRVVTQFAYDEFANNTVTTEYGDYDAGGDERTTARGYVANQGSYIVGLPAYENRYAGIGTSGALAAQVLYLYDGNGTYSAAPSRGDLTAKQLWNNATGGYLTSSFGYDGYGNQVSETSPAGATKTRSYDPAYHLFQVTDCDQIGWCTATAWDYGLASPVAVTDENGATASTSYDSLGRPVQVTKPDGAAEYFSYLDWGSPNAQRVRHTSSDGSPDGLWIETYYDGLQRDWRTVREGGLIFDKIYADASDRVWKRSNNYQAGDTPRYSTTTYDGSGRKRRTTNPDGTYAEIVYGDGLVTAYDELGHWETRVVDGFGRLKQVQDQAGGVTNHTYDALDNRISTTDAAGNVTSIAYNSVAQRTQLCDGDTGCTTFQYGSGGLPSSQTDAKGQTIGFTYDAAGRLTTKTYPDGAQVIVAYDQDGHGAGRGRATTVTDPTGSESRTFDWAGRITSTLKCVQGICETTSSGFDGLGRLASTTYPDGEVVGYGYGGDGRLANVSGYVNAIGYNAESQITSIAYANGTTATYSYNTDRNALTTSQLNGPGGLMYQASYGYDAGARVVSTSSMTNPLMNVGYDYDALNRLTSVTGAQSQSFAYDALGNMTSNSAVGSYGYASGKPHAVTSAGGNSYGYDANGNMTSGAGRTLTWDYDNRLTSVTAGDATSSFAYDHQGQRVWKASAAGEVRTFGDRVELEGDRLIKYYYAGPILVAKRTPEGPAWFHSDHLGSTKVLADAAGSTLRTYDYAPFGATIATSGSAANDREFQGHKAEPGAGLIFMQGRYYDAGLARFVSADSMVPDGGNPQALNRYSFVYNNPVMNIDPSGHAPIVAAVVMAVIANTTVAWVAVAVIAVGYVTHNPLLMTIGSIMAGYPNVFGMAIAAVTSPLSPLNPKLKQAIGWAYTAYSLFDWATNNASLEAAKKQTADSQAQFKAVQDAAAQSGGELTKYTYKNVAFGDNSFVGGLAEKLGWTHVTTQFVAPDGSSVTFNVQTLPRPEGLWSDFKSLVETLTGKEPVFNMNGFTNSTSLQLVSTETVSLAQFTSFGDAYLASMQANMLPGGYYNGGQSNNAVNAGNAASNAPRRWGPTCTFCK